MIAHPTELVSIVSKAQRVAIVGGPKTGKTTLSCYRQGVIHTDDFIPMGWEASADRAFEIAADRESFVIEGVRAEGALRRGLEVDAVIWLRKPVKARTVAQSRMGDAHDRRFARFVPHLRVPIITA